jgi:hypothetical protein
MDFNENRLHDIFRGFPSAHSFLNKSVKLGAEFIPNIRCRRVHAKVLLFLCLKYIFNGNLKGAGEFERQTQGGHVLVRLERDDGLAGDTDLFGKFLLRQFAAIEPQAADFIGDDRLLHACFPCR